MFIVFAVLFFVAIRELIPAIMNILMLLVGLFSMASLSSFHRIIETGKDRPFINITFNEQIISNQLEEAVESMDTNIIDAEIINNKPEPWGIEAEDLLGQDNSLALAKMRIDIERELKQIARFSGIESHISKLGLMTLSDELTKREILSPSIVSILRDILPVMNQSIHGKDVSIETASTIVRLGKKLLTILESISFDQKRKSEMV